MASNGALIALVGCVVLGLGVAVLAIKQLLVVVMPDELVVLVGRRYKLPDGRVIGYRVLTGGRVFRIPLIEKVIRMPKGPYGGELDLQGVLDKGNVRMRFQGTAEIKISDHPVDMGNAVERFMGSRPAEITLVAMETLKGQIRQVMASLEGQEAVGDPIRFQQMLFEESEADFSKLGLVVDAFRPSISFQDPATDESIAPAASGQGLLEGLASDDLGVDAKRALVDVMGEKRFSLGMDVERTDPPSPEDLPEIYRDGLSAIGTAVKGLEVEVVYPARHRAEVELMEGGGLEIEVQVRVFRWDAPRQRLVVLAD